MQRNNKATIIISLLIILIFGGVLFFSLSANPGNTSPQAVHDINAPKSVSGSNSGQGNFNFTAQEPPSFNFPNVAYASDVKNKTEIYNSKGQKVGANLNVNQKGTGSEITLNPSQSFTPGKYTISINENGKKITQDFTWGVLAINPDKSIYTPGETANLALAVLDEHGNMVCDAKVNLTITQPSGKSSTATVGKGDIGVNPECHEKSYTTKPDYQTSYKLVGGVGTYRMDLNAQTQNGTYSITDFLVVEQSVDFDVQRVTATRIFPYSDYPVLLKITANKDFSGQITETVPSSFTITPLDNTINYINIKTDGKTQNIIWNISIKKGQTVNLGYNFKAPEISPQFYLLGPLTFTSQGTTVFQETRQWQLAIDGLSYASTVISDGATSYWRLGEASGHIVDSIAGNNSTSETSETYGVTGAISGDSNTATTGTTTSSKFSVPAATALNLGDTFTIEFWVKRSATQGTTQVIMDKGNTSGDAYGIYFQTGNQIIFTDSTSGSTIIKTTTNITDQNWHYVVWTKSGSTNHAYLDGVANETAGVNITLANSTNPLIIDSDAAGVTSYLGTLDEVALYKGIVLSSTQVANHYLAANSGSCSSSSYQSTILADNPLSYYRLDASSGSTETDLGSAAVNGTYHNGFTLNQTGLLTNDTDDAAAFDGSSGTYLRIGSGYKQPIDDTFSIEFWIKPADLTSGERIYGMSGSGTSAAIALGGASKRVYIGYTNFNSMGTNNTDLVVGNTYYVVWTKSGSTNHIYINGVDDTGTITNQTLSHGSNGDGDTYWFVVQDGTNGSYHGTADEVAVYTTALSSTQVTAHYNAGIAASACGDFLFQGIQTEGIQIN